MLASAAGSVDTSVNRLLPPPRPPPGDPGGAPRPDPAPGDLLMRQAEVTAAPAPAPSPPRTGWATLGELNRYHWFVFAVAAIAWMADCMDQQFFNLARRMSITDLVGG